MKYLQDTPTEKYNGFYVKREDLACLPPGPPFAKVRGLYYGLKEMKSRGIDTVGYYETSVSMATWGVAYLCQELGMKAVVYYYKYKDGPKYNQEKQFKIWKRFNVIVHINKQPQMQKIHESMSKRKFLEKYSKGEFLPAGLKFDQTVQEVSKQVENVPKKALGGTIVICTGSGMMASGVLNGIYKYSNKKQNIIGVIVHPKSVTNLKKKIIKRVGVLPILLNNRINFKVIDYGYIYTKREDCKTEFSCCPYYDKKAYKYMVDNYKQLKKPVLFWNIGSEYII